MIGLSSPAADAWASARHGARAVHHQVSHAALTRSVGRARDTASARPVRVDAVIVPASRGAAALDGAAHLAARLEATLIVLCSRQTQGDVAAARVVEAVGCRVVAIDVPAGYRHDLMPTRTVAPRFRSVSAARDSDLSVKRNIGLLLARLHAWGKVIFLDDDIGSPAGQEPSALPDDAARRLVSALDSYQIAGLTCDAFPDNSVLCHARRLAGFEQNTFISGAALGVNCHDHPLPFFPDQYNEDWFFFSRRVASRDIAHVGGAVQATYDPFATPERARQEEFGDLMAEGLFSLFEHQPRDMEYRRRLDAADALYWERSIAERAASNGATRLALATVLENDSADVGASAAAIRSLEAAGDQLSHVTPTLCIDYLAAWAEDLVEWERAGQRIRAVRSTAEAMDVLGLRNWSAADGMTATAAAWT